MKNFIAATILTSISFAPSFAMPLLAPGNKVGDIIQVAGGCGPGWHRGPFNGCLRDFADPAAHACPRGFHVGPGGGCKGNGR